MLAHPFQSPLRARSAMFSALVGAAVLLSSCSAIDVKTRAMPILASTEIESFAWDPQLEPNEELDAQLRPIVVSHMTRMGLRPVEVGQADLLVTYSTGVETRRRIFDHEDDIYYGVEEFEVGTIGLHLKERSSGELVWQGQGSSSLRKSAVAYDEFGDDLYPTDEPRNWRLERKLDVMFERLRRDLGRSGPLSGELASAPELGASASGTR